MSAAVLFPAGAFADSLSYDPDRCASEAEGMVYLALGREVLRFPADDLTLIRDPLPEQRAEMPAPPNPDVPEGCPDHPIQGRGFTFSYLYEAIRKNKRDPQLSTDRPNILRLILAEPDFWGTQEGSESYYARVCDQFQEQQSLANGLVGCWIPMKDRTQPREAWAVYLKAAAAVYTAPFDRPFIVACNPRGAAGDQTCRISYKLYETVNISYGVTVQNRSSERYVPLDHIIEFDRGIRAMVDAARISDFHWPAEQK